MKAVIVSETPTEKVIERRRRKLVTLGVDTPIGLLINITTAPTVLIGTLSAFMDANPMQGGAFLAAGLVSFVASTRGKGLESTIKEFTGVDKNKKELNASLTEGQRIQLGEPQFTKKPDSFKNGSWTGKLYEDKNLSTHEVKNYVKKTNGKLVFEQVITELPMHTWFQTFSELVDNSGLEMVDVSSNPVPDDSRYFFARSKGTLDEYKANLHGSTPTKIEA